VHCTAFRCLCTCAVLVLFLTTPAPVAASHHERVLKESSGKKPLQTERPYNIAHRGANGELPEETHAAYERAVVEGTDFLETDIISTKDGKLICFHDLTLDATTNVANHTEFKDRVRTYEVQGANVTGFFTVDFTLAEILTLRAVQRWPFRDQSYNG
jgi:glycerophosphoryl diester phosphodiesterase